MLSLLYDIFISPLIMGMNFVLVNAYSILDSYGLAIVVLSLVVNTVLLPLYHMADKWQQEEREKQNKMADKVAEIKQAFQGQERFMMLKTLYRQNHYHPIMAVRNSVGFLIQVPFFFAAYQLLSHFPELNGQSFGPFANLGLPDGLLTIGDLHINVMPFVMTGINLLSAFVYTKGLSSKDKIQLYVFAGIFLVLLYTSPVGLVLYWTLNNVYSLGKNLVSKFWKNLNNQYFLLIINPIIIFCYVMLLYSILSFLFYNILPDGVTKDFFIRSFPYYSIVPLLCFFYIVIKLIYNNENNFNKKREDICIFEVTFIIIPMIPLSQYVISNANILTIYDIIYSIIMMVIIISVIVIMIPYYLSSILDKKILQSAILAIVLLIAFMPLVSSIFHFSRVGSLTKLLPLLLISVMLSIVIVFINNKKVVIFFIVLFVSNSISVYINSDSVENVKHQKNNIQQFSSFKVKNNVYLLTYDAYVNSETMNMYGINNKKHEAFLKDNGFTIYPEVYSIAAGSTATMGRVLNMTSINNGLLEAVAGDGIVFDIFKWNSYSTAGYFENSYFFTGTENKYDFSYPKIVGNVNPINMIYTSILSGFFRFDLGFDNFSKKDFLDNKYKYFNNIKNNNFIYMHTGPGHSQNSGQCLSNEIELFKERLDIANNEMLKDIKTIEDKDPNAIIIINGDHGPYLTKNCVGLNKHYSSSEIDRLDMQDRYGTFLAIKLPNGDVIGHNKLKILQDIFPEVFNYLTKSNYFDTFKLKTRTVEDVTSGVYIENGIIHGGKNDGEQLFLGENNAK